MENSFYILSNRPVIITRLHLCTWDLIGQNALFEVGIEFRHSSGETVEFALHLPFLDERSKSSCLYKALRNEKNAQFIFNDVCKSKEMLSESSDDGCRLNFESTKSLVLRPVTDSAVKAPHLLRFSALMSPSQTNEAQNYYCRMLIHSNLSTFATTVPGIAKESLIYDIKINERRNRPPEFSKIKQELKGFEICDVEKVFCMHAYPQEYRVVQFSPDKSTKIRKLESEAFQNYLKDYTLLKEDHYIFLFNKESHDETKLKEGFSFFTILERESIGRGQVILAIIINVFCCWLFAALPHCIDDDHLIDAYVSILGFIVVLSIYFFHQKVKR